MIDAQAPLQRAIFAAVRGDDEVQALIGTRFFDRVPTNAQGQPLADYPFAGFDRFSSAGVGGPCDTGDEIDVQISGWSRAVGSVEAKRIGAALRRVLTAPFDVEGFNITIARFIALDTQTGRDGLTSQTILRMRFSLSPKP